MVRCEEMCVLEEIFVRYSGGSEKKKSVPVNMDTKVAAHKDSNQKEIRLTLDLEIGNQDTEEYPVYYFIKIVGIVSWDEGDWDEVEDKVVGEGSELLFSFVRSYFYEKLSRAKIDGIVLPLLVKLQENGVD